MTRLLLVTIGAGVAVALAPRAAVAEPPVVSLPWPPIVLPDNSSARTRDGGRPSALTSVLRKAGDPSASGRRPRRRRHAPLGPGPPHDRGQGARELRLRGAGARSIRLARPRNRIAARTTPESDSLARVLSRAPRACCLGGPAAGRERGLAPAPCPGDDRGGRLPTRARREAQRRPARDADRRERDCGDGQVLHGRARGGRPRARPRPDPVGDSARRVRRGAEHPAALAHDAGRSVRVAAPLRLDGTLTFAPGHGAATRSA